MLKLLALALLLLTLTPTLAQTAAPTTAASARYGIVEAYHQAKGRAHLELLVGLGSSASPIDQASEQKARVKVMVYETEALDYLSTCGWEVIAVTPLTNSAGATAGIRYYLRRYAN